MVSIGDNTEMKFSCNDLLSVYHFIYIALLFRKILLKMRAE